MATYESINISEKFSRLSEHWQPRVIAEINDYQVKIVKVEGDFVWHRHVETDEAFIVLDGELRIDFRDGSVTIRAGEMFVVGKGIEHKPFARSETRILVIEPRGVVNTGDVRGPKTSSNDHWI